MKFPEDLIEERASLLAQKPVRDIVMQQQWAVAAAKICQSALVLRKVRIVERALELKEMNAVAEGRR